MITREQAQAVFTAFSALNAVGIWKNHVSFSSADATTDVHQTACGAVGVFIASCDDTQEHEIEFDDLADFAKSFKI